MCLVHLSNRCLILEVSRGILRYLTFISMDAQRIRAMPRMIQETETRKKGEKRRRMRQTKWSGSGCGPVCVDRYVWTGMCGPVCVDRYVWTGMCVPVAPRDQRKLSHIW
jgi:hypothetical protein